MAEAAEVESGSSVPPASEVLRQHLVEELEIRSFLHSATIRQAFLAVPREYFLAGVDLERVYSDEAIVVKWDAQGNPSSSSTQPGLMADMLEALDLQPGMRVLEIGAGVGYNAALLGTLVGDPALVTTIDIDPEMTARVRQNLGALGAEWERLNVVTRDGSLGYTEDAPYDRIIVTVQQWEIAPAWVDQLKVGGRLLLPISISTRVWNSLIPAFVKRADGVLQAVDASQGGFMLMRGILQHPTTNFVPASDTTRTSLLEIPATLLPEGGPSDSTFCLSYDFPDAISNYIWQPHSSFTLGMSTPARLGKEVVWAKMNSFQRSAILQRQSFQLFLAMATQQQFGSLVLKTEIQPEAPNKVGPAEVVSQPQYNFNPVGSAVVVALADGSFDVALLLLNNLVVGLRLLAPDSVPSDHILPNQALAEVATAQRLWVQAGCLFVSQYRPLAYPSDQPQPVPGLIIPRHYYNLLLPLQQ
jgi:protein-L-isoaspartate(D-aspartate) O-methyltransferase